MSRDLELTLPARVESVAEARAAAGPLLEGLSDDVREGVRVVVSELVTNAVRHGPGGNVTVRLQRDGKTIRGEVEDEGREIVVGPIEPATPRGGFGLRVVNALSDKWGVSKGSTHVWFELSDG
jgi:signal transduction histidine kinase